MKLAVSNIAWEHSENTEVVSLLRNYNVSGIELAPTKRWVNPDQAIDNEVAEYRDYWFRQDLVPIAMQSLLFNRPHLTLFGDTKSDMIQYLKAIIRLAGKLSTKTLVFGSPKNRLVRIGEYSECYEEAVLAFRELGDEAERCGVLLAIEPNPQAYGCNFITSTAEGLQFIKDIDNDGVKLHLDTGTMLLNEEDVASILPECLLYAAHFHVSDPYLLIPGAQEYRHGPIAQVLKNSGYAGWISLEMKGGIMPDNKEAITLALEYINRVYL